MTKNKAVTNDVRAEFLWLNRLRERGTMNMFGASEPLGRKFGLDKREASKVLMEWMGWVESNPSNRDL